MSEQFYRRTERLVGNTVQVEYVPVVRCEHREHDYPNGHIDGHFFYDWDSKEVPSAEWCPGAGIGDTDA